MIAKPNEINICNLDYEFLKTPITSDNENIYYHI